MSKLNIYRSKGRLVSNLNSSNAELKIIQVVIEFIRIGEIGNSCLIEN